MSFGWPTNDCADHAPHSPRGRHDLDPSWKDTIMTSSKLRRSSGGLAALLALTLTIAACGGGTTRGEEEDSGDSQDSVGEADPNAEIQEGLHISFLPKQINNPYFTVADGGGETAVGELGGEYEEVGPSEATASSQVSYINTLTQQSVDAIVTSANDPNAICGALNQARSAGAVVVTYDSDTNPECRDLFINQATSDSIAKIQLKLIADQIGGSGQVAILSATPNATNQNAWIDVMEQELKKPEYSDIELVEVAYGNDDDEKSFQETQGLLSSYPDLAGIISPTTVGIAAAARYISGSEYKGQVALTGLGT